MRAAPARAIRCGRYGSGTRVRVHRAQEEFREQSDERGACEDAVRAGRTGRPQRFGLDVSAERHDRDRLQDGVGFERPDQGGDIGPSRVQIQQDQSRPVFPRPLFEVRSPVDGRGADPGRGRRRPDAGREDEIGDERDDGCFFLAKQESLLTGSKCSDNVHLTLPGTRAGFREESRMAIATHPPRSRPFDPAESEARLREALEANGQRFTEQRAAVYRYLLGTDQHPTADDVFTAVRVDLPDISLATVYKSLETLVGCGLATKLTYGDGSARYDGRTDPHPHARCLTCGTVIDVPGRLDPSALERLGPVTGFEIEGYRLELVGHCDSCRS